VWTSPERRNLNYRSFVFSIDGEASERLLPISGRG
jgi:hypothetical protein